MRLITPLKLALTHRIICVSAAQYHLVGTISLCFSLEDKSLIPYEEALKDINKVLGKIAIPYFDTVSPKERGEVLVLGHSMIGTSLPHKVSIKIGPLYCDALIFGQRFWKKERNDEIIQQQGEEIEKVPLTPENAFGGPTFQPNLVGLGHQARKKLKTEPLVPLPLIENPYNPIKTPDDEPEPIWFSNTPLWFPERQSQAGTYDDKWFKYYHPGLPLDFDPLFYNEAHPRLWLPNTQPFFHGDEEFHLVGLREFDIYGALPGYRVRMFLYIDKNLRKPMLYEAPKVNLDTVVFIPDPMIGICIYRATFVLGNDPLGLNITALATAYEWLHDPARDDLHYQTHYSKRVQGFASAEEIVDDKPISPRIQEEITEDTQAAQQEAIKEVQKVHDEVKNWMYKQAGVSPKFVEKKVQEQVAKNPRMAEIQKRLDKIERERQMPSENTSQVPKAQKISSENTSQMPKQQPMLTERGKQTSLENSSQMSKQQPMLTERGKQTSLENSSQMPKQQPMTSEKTQSEKEKEGQTSLDKELQDIKGEVEDFADEIQAQKLLTDDSPMLIDPHLDLNKMPKALPRHPKLFDKEIKTRLTQKNASPTEMNIVASVMKVSMLPGAEKMEPPEEHLKKLNESRQMATEPILMWQKMTKEDAYIFGQAFIKKALEKKDFSGLDLAYMIVSEATLLGLLFTGTFLEHTWFLSTVIKKCDFTKANLSKAEFFNVEFLECRFHETTLGETAFKHCRFVDCTFKDLYIQGLITENVRIEKAEITNCNLLDLKGGKFRMSDVIWKGGCVSNCDFSKSQWKRMTIEDISFMNVNLQETEIVDSYCYKLFLLSSKAIDGIWQNVEMFKCYSVGAGGEFMNMVLTGVILEKCGFRDNKFMKIRMEECRCTDTDFSMTDMSDMYARGVVFTDSLFAGTNLQRADLERAYMLRCSLRQADLTDANLTATCLFEADLCSTTFKNTRVEFADFRRTDYDHKDKIPAGSFGTKDLG